MVGGFIEMGGRRRLARLTAAALVALALLALGAQAALGAPTLVIEAPANGSFTNHTSPAISGTTTSSENPVTVKIYEGSSASGTLVQTPTATPEGGSWSATPSALGQGTYTAVAEQSELGETASSNAVTFTVDTTPPHVTMDSVPSPTNEAAPALHGQLGTEEGDLAQVSVTIYSGSSPGGSVVYSGSALVSGSEWTYAPPGELKDGTYTAQAKQSDRAGNSASATQTFTVKTAPPAVSLDQPKSPTNDATPTLTGKAGTAEGDEASVEVKIYEGSSAIGTVAASGSASVSGATWSYTAPHLADGTYTAQASQKDQLGNTGKSAPETFTIDTVAPVVTMRSVPSPSKNASPTLEGQYETATGDLGAVQVTVYEGSSVGGSVVASGAASVSNGSWSYHPTLREGTFTARAEQTDTAGNTGYSSPVSFTIKVSKPVVTLNAPEALSNDSTPSFSGGADAGEGDIPSVTLRVYAGNQPSGTVIRKVTVGVSGGAWSTGAVEKLADGTYTAQAEQQDEAGNTGLSAPATFTIDTAPPAVSITPPPTPSNDSTPTLEGHKATASVDEPSVLVTVYAGSSVAGPVVASQTLTGSGSSWSYTTPALSDGTYTAQAEQRDQLGNSGKSSAVSFTIDTKAPSVSLNAPASLSNNATPTLSGSAGTETGDSSSVTVTIYEGSSTAGHVVRSASAPASGGSWSYSSPKLADGTYTAQAEQKDSAGNVGSSAAQTFTVDTASPTVTLSSPAPLSNNTTPSFSGTASDTTPVTVALYKGSSASGTPVWETTTAVSSGHWSSQAVNPPLANGQYTALASEPSSLGNAPGKSSPASFTVNTAAPTVTLSQPASPSNNREPAFTGTASESEPVTIKVYEGKAAAGTPVATTTASPSGGAWTSAAVKPALASGEHTYTAVASQNSSIGNGEGTSVPVTFVVDTNSPKVTLAALKSPTKVATPSFTGTASDTMPVTVAIYKGSSVSGSPVASATAASVETGGAWTSAAASPALAEGTYTAQATQPSSLKNPEGKSEAITFAVDTAPPLISINAVAPATNNAKPTFSGTAGTKPGDSPTVTVTIYSGTAVLESATVAKGEVSAGTKGAWSFTPSVPATLADGSYTVQATQTDEAGNIGSTPPATFKVITVAPTVTLNQPPGKTNNREPVFSGTASAAAKVTVKILNEKGTQVSSAEVASPPFAGGAWTSKPASPALPSEKGKKTYTATATQTDEAGNTTTTKPVTFTVDVEAPTVAINPVPARTNDRTPAFSGEASDTEPVTVYIYSAARPPAEACVNPGSPVTSASAQGTGRNWESGPTNAPLPDGSYTAVAVQKSGFGNHCSETAPVSFTVDTVAPHVTIGSPASGSTGLGESQAVSGTAGAEQGDVARVSVELFAGEAANQSPVETVSASVTRGVWSTVLAGLSPGTYTVRAQQADEAGNAGTSSAVVFHIAAPAAAAAQGKPAASFSWYPPSPHVGEPVSLVSSSTDAASPLNGFAWDLSGGGVFQPSGPVTTTTFATAGNHTVSLRVSDASGAASVASETIAVSRAAVPVLAPFPLVRIVSSRIGSAVRLRLLSILASPGAHVSITCKGHGCPVKKESKIAAAGKVGLASVSFGRFQRTLPPGTTLEIRIYRPGEIGKYTALIVHRGGVLRRLDMCLSPNGLRPMTCPSG